MVILIPAHVNKNQFALCPKGELDRADAEAGRLGERKHVACVVFASHASNF